VHCKQRRSVAVPTASGRKIRYVLALLRRSFTASERMGRRWTAAGLPRTLVLYLFSVGLVSVDHLASKTSYAGSKLPARNHAMSLGVNLSHEEIAQLRRVTKTSDDAEAVSIAAREYLRLSRLRELKSLSGRVDFEDNWSELESMEANEIDFPQ
jgi:hypothetical protein